MRITYSCSKTVRLCGNATSRWATISHPFLQVNEYVVSDLAEALCIVTCLPHVMSRMKFLESNLENRSGSQNRRSGLANTLVHNLHYKLGTSC
jgi:hypothetical protein